MYCQFGDSSDYNKVRSKNMQKHNNYDNLMKSFCLFFCFALLIIISACSTKITPVTLSVTRLSPLRPLPALNITIRNQQAVQQLYQAAYNLPDAGNGKRNCTEDDGIIYHLNFSQDANTSDEMDVQPSGCLILTTSQGSLQENYQFLALVMKTIHVNPLVPRLVL
jgi:hypothetical protein